MVPEPIPVVAFEAIVVQRSLSGSPLGSPATTADMLAFAARHNIAPVTETFSMSKVNEALGHLRAGKARYRIVLENDFAREMRNSNSELNIRVSGSPISAGPELRTPNFLEIT
ncbi:MAG: hypothetical protein U0792_15560 [Gemmataceae bacterium]